jgi:hypothetical protein
VFTIKRERTDVLSGRHTSETIHGITSLSAEKAGPERLLELNRKHWTIENRLHWVRDVTFDEDRSRVRRGNGAHMMASLRNLAISVLRMAGARYIPPAIRHCARGGDAVVFRLIGLEL